MEMTSFLINGKKALKHCLQRPIISKGVGLPWGRGQTWGSPVDPNCSQYEQECYIYGKSQDLLS